MGEILAETPKAPGGGDQRSPDDSDSSRAQKLAKVPEEKFEEYLSTSAKLTGSDNRPGQLYRKPVGPSTDIRCGLCVETADTYRPPSSVTGTKQ